MEFSYRANNPISNGNDWSLKKKISFHIYLRDFNEISDSKLKTTNVRINGTFPER